MESHKLYFLLLVAAFGALGCAARYAVASALAGQFGKEFPYGTFAVNVAGSLLIGLIAEWAGREPSAISLIAKRALVAGFLGGFTTFSAFSLETVELLLSGKTVLAFLNIGATLACCFLGTWVGILIGRQV
jgi:CrcB protein